MIVVNKIVIISQITIYHPMPKPLMNFVFVQNTWKRVIVPVAMDEESDKVFTGDVGLKAKRLYIQCNNIRIWL